MLGADFGELAAPEPCLAEQKTRCMPHRGVRTCPSQERGSCRHSAPLKPSRGRASSRSPSSAGDLPAETGSKVLPRIGGSKGIGAKIDPGRDIGCEVCAFAAR